MTKTLNHIGRLVIVLSIQLSGIAQHTFQKTEHKGEEYYIYPYDLQDDFYEIAPLGEALPDGKFIVYFSGKGKKIAGKFSAKDGQINGPATFYYEEKPKNILWEGHYKDGLKDSIWSIYFNQSLKNSAYRDDWGLSLKVDRATRRKKRYYQMSYELQAPHLHSPQPPNFFRQRWGRSSVFIGSTPSSHTINFEKGLANGRFEVKNLETDRLSQVGQFKDGKISGVWKFYDGEGSLIKSYRLVDTLQDPQEYESYYSNGQRKAVFSYTNSGQPKDGYTYYEDGKLRSFEAYANSSVQDSVCYFLDPSGDTIYDAHYEHGKIVKERGFIDGVLAYHRYHRMMGDSVLLKYTIDTMNYIQPYFYNFSPIEDDPLDLKIQEMSLEYKFIISDSFKDRDSYGFRDKYAYVRDDYEGTIDSTENSFPWEERQHKSVSYLDGRLISAHYFSDQGQISIEFEKGNTEKKTYYKADKTVVEWPEFNIQFELPTLQKKVLILEELHFQLDELKSYIPVVGVNGKPFNGKVEFGRRKRTLILKNEAGEMLQEIPILGKDRKSIFVSRYERPSPMSRRTYLRQINLKDFAGVQFKNGLPNQAIVKMKENGKGDAWIENYTCTLEEAAKWESAFSKIRQRKNLYNKTYTKSIYLGDGKSRLEISRQYFMKKMFKDEKLTDTIIELVYDEGQQFLKRYDFKGKILAEASWENDSNFVYQSHYSTKDSVVVKNNLLNGTFVLRGGWTHYYMASKRGLPNRFWGKISAKDGQFHGPYVGSDQKAFYENGLLIGNDTSYYYGTLQHRRVIEHSKEDSAYHSHEGYQRLGYETNYYKTGVKSREGKYSKGLYYIQGQNTENFFDYDYLRSGNWYFYNELGDTVKSIQYNDQNDQRFGSQKVDENGQPDLGQITEWHDNGHLKSEGYILEESYDIHCDSELDPISQVIRYKNFWHHDGTQIVKDGNGFVNNYHRNGVLSEKGNIKNGYRDGLWEFYDPEGKLIETGTYIEGIKDGRWIKGDLSGLKYLEGACYISEKAFKEALEENKGRVDIDVGIYKNGQLLSGDTFKYDNGEPTRSYPGRTYY